MEVFLQVTLGIIIALIGLMALSALPWVLLFLCAWYIDKGWTGPRKEAGPLPLSSADTPIIRLVDTRATFETTYKRLLWDEGDGPILAEERIKALLDSVPKEFMDRLTAARGYYDAWGIVVSLHPDVLIVTVRTIGCSGYAFRNWDWPFATEDRRAYVNRSIEKIAWHSPLSIYVGTLVPWGNEMHVFSTDPKIKNGRLKFDYDQAEAEVALPVGKLVLLHHSDDVDVTRQ